MLINTMKLRLELRNDRQNTSADDNFHEYNTVFGTIIPRNIKMVDTCLLLESSILCFRNI